MWKTTKQKKEKVVEKIQQKFYKWTLVEIRDLRRFLGISNCLRGKEEMVEDLIAFFIEPKEISKVKVGRKRSRLEASEGDDDHDDDKDEEIKESDDDDDDGGEGKEEGDGDGSKPPPKKKAKKSTPPTTTSTKTKKKKKGKKKKTAKKTKKTAATKKMKDDPQDDEDDEKKEDQDDKKEDEEKPKTSRGKSGAGKQKKGKEDSNSVSDANGKGKGKGKGKKKTTSKGDDQKLIRKHLEHYLQDEPSEEITMAMLVSALEKKGVSSSIILKNKDFIKQAAREIVEAQS